MNRAQRNLCAIGVLLFLPHVIWSQSTATEFWEGNRSSAGKSQTLLLHVDQSNGLVKATVDLPDFGALEIPGAAFSMANGRIHFELVGDTSSAVFDGNVTTDSIRGIWHEGDRSGEFELRRARNTNAGLREEEVFFSNGNIRLAGTLLLPATQAPTAAIIFVQGAGGETRNASRFLAEFFIEQGVAALIYDKRGTGTSTGDWMHSSFEDLAGDAVAAVNYLKARREIDPSRIGLMGSSQGGWVAPIAAIHSTDIHFLIVKSAACVTPEDQELARVEMKMRSDGNTSQEIEQALGLYRQVIAYARTQQGWDELSVALKAASQKSWYPFGTVSKDWWFFDNIRLSFGYDPLPTLQRLKTPALIIFGGRDADMPVDTSLARLVPALSAGGNGTIIEVFPNAGHDLRVEAGKGDPWDFPRFAPGYLELLASWVKLQTEADSAAKGQLEQRTK